MSAPLPLGERKYQVQRIQDNHQEMMRLMVLGWSNKDIAQHFGCSTALVCAVRNSEITRKRLNLMQAARTGAVLGATEKLKDAAPIAASILVDMMQEDEVPKMLKKQIAFGILDRTGHGPTTKVESKHMVGIYTMEDHMELMKRRNDAIEQGILIEEEAS